MLFVQVVEGLCAEIEKFVAAHCNGSDKIESYFADKLDLHSNYFAEQDDANDIVDVRKLLADLRISYDDAAAITKVTRLLDASKSFIETKHNITTLSDLLLSDKSTFKASLETKLARCNVKSNKDDITLTDYKRLIVLRLRERVLEAVKIVKKFLDTRQLHLKQEEFDSKLTSVDSILFEFIKKEIKVAQKIHAEELSENSNVLGKVTNLKSIGSCGEKTTGKLFRYLATASIFCSEVDILLFT